MMIERRAFTATIPLLDRARTIQEVRLGVESERLVFTLSNLALARQGGGDTQAARPLFARSLQPAHVHGHRAEAPIMTDLAALDCMAGRRAAALAMLATARPAMADAYPDDPWRTAWIDQVRGRCLNAHGRTAEEDRLLRSSTPVVRSKWPAGTVYGDGLGALSG